MTPRWPSPADIPDATADQQRALARFTGWLSILAGRPGTGKSWLIAAMLKHLLAHGARLLVMAPTGKAAVRVTESLSHAGVPGVVARTIHSALKMAPDGPPEFNEANPLEADYIFVDEASMIDTTIMAHLLAARPAGCHLLLVGDPDQLSPVGHGAPLRDLIAAGLPCGSLTEIQRNSGRIVQVCKEIAERHTFTPSPKVDLESKPPENFGWIECSTPELQIERLKGTLDKLRDRGFDPIGETQVIVAVNQKSPLGRVPLNRLLQGYLNPTGERVDGNPFRVGDKIVCQENGTVPAEGDRQPEVNAEGRIAVKNGEQARVVEVFPRYTVAAMEAPERLIRIPLGEASNDNGDGDEEKDDSDTGCKWQLAYAITLHKAQGSQWRVVIPMIDSYPGAVRLCKREWPYTAFSRASELTIGIGKLSLARAMCRTSGLADRKTFLVETIESLRAEGLGSVWEELLEV